MMAEPLLAGILLGGVAAWGLLALVGLWQERRKVEEPATRDDDKLQIILSVVSGCMVMIEFSEPVKVLVLTPVVAMRFFQDGKRAAARAMEHPPAAEVEGT
mgnify:CR=1 FL=1